MSERTWNGYVLTGKDYAGRVWYADLWHPETHETLHVACEDTEYWDGFTMGLVNHSYSPEDRIAMLKLPYFGGSKEIEKAYNDWSRDEDYKAGKVCEGFIVEVFKGRKFPIGTRATVKGFSKIYDRYGRNVGMYVVATDGKRIPWENVKVVGREW